jgi:RHH-type transcriptional regulator, proline utilization regulon repressor / proline dehydrogenase / delta 1-pyrroline-5-carboxylate dehydrogenase
VSPLDTLHELLADLEVDPRSSTPPVVQKALGLARRLQVRAAELQTPQEKRQQRELERMMDSPEDKWTLTQMTDQAFRSKVPRRAADQLIHILDVQGVPRFFSAFERALLRGFQSFGGYLPGVSVPMVKEKMREETANVILPAEDDVLLMHLRERRQSGVRMNVNFLGEALLGEEDAQKRLASYLQALQFSEIECLSVKISTIYSQISGIARKTAIRVLCDRLELLYRAAQKARFERADGTVVPKFVYLDMEEYRDLSITLEVFMRTLERPGLEKVNAGIALQAYIPDSHLAQKQINAWARERRKRGGAPVTIRLVKGANMEAERVEASIRGWPQAPFKTKAETDANYKRMLHEAMGSIDAVHLGVGTHNLFEVAYALVLGHEHGALDRMQVEMLEGMANHQRRALGELAPAILLYAPATRQEEFVNAIGYLIRRLDENTGPENFLRWAFKLQVDSEDWQRLAAAFAKSFDLVPDLRSESRRTQDRRESLGPSPGAVRLADFESEPDTDFALPQNVAWVESIIERWKKRTGPDAVEVPIVVAGEEILDRPIRDAVDPSRPGTVVARTRQATADDIDRAVACARRDPGGWRALPADRRGAILAAAAQELRKARADLVGAAMADGGKIATESDPEVSEAVDFVEYYAATARELAAIPTLKAAPKGVVVVVSPWNFPIAIPCGGVAAGLAAGNCVLLKPASDTVLCAWELCQCFWRAGVPREALQFVPCSGGSVGSRLVASPDVDVVILTGGTDTALRMLDAAPRMNLLAETGGKNATVVTAMSDREQAIKHLLHSAFSHSGQKCSATSLLVLEAEVYDDPHFKQTLCDAVRSMQVGSAWELDTRMGPLIRPPSGDLEKGLKDLEEGESWAVMPRLVADNPGLWSPAVKWGVRRKSYTHMTEFFGPVLAVLRAKDLEEAIDIVNDTGYGLTSGLESLDEREQALWKSRIRAGNLYLDRVTTGAVVQRQPFGGYGKSSFGPGIKAGGPNYVAQLMDFRDDETAARAIRGEADEALEPFRAALAEHLRSKDCSIPKADGELALAACVSYGRAWKTELGAVHDDQRLVGQDNFRRYLPVGEVRVRVHPDDSAFQIFARVLAARQTGNHVTVSSPPDLDAPAVEVLDQLTEPWGAGIELVEESDEALAAVIAGRQTDRVRYAAPDRVPEAVLRAVGETGVYIARAPVLAEGRIELLWYMREQSVSHDYHRYGNLGIRAGEERGRVA